MSYLHYLCPTPIVLCLFSFVLCTPCCQFLWIVHLVLPRRYSLMLFDIEYLVLSEYYE